MKKYLILLIYFTIFVITSYAQVVDRTYNPTYESKVFSSDLSTGYDSVRVFNLNDQFEFVTVTVKDTGTAIATGDVDIYSGIIGQDTLKALDTTWVQLSGIGLFDRDTYETFGEAGATRTYLLYDPLIDLIKVEVLTTASDSSKLPIIIKAKKGIFR